MSQSDHPLKMAERFLKQQRELYGDELYKKSGRTILTPPASPASGKRDHPSLNERSWGTLKEFSQHICDCQNCSLGKTRTHFVFGVGDPKAKLVLVGEAPGAEEDAQGEPFVGRAGQLLNKILEAIQLKREEVYICNILKCRPPQNRDPLPEEVSECEPYLQEQLRLIQPRVILALGRIAGNTLLKKQESLGNLRGKVHDYQGIKLIVTYHPAALLRNPNWKKPTWEDIQFMKKVLDESVSLSK